MEILRFLETIVTTFPTAAKHIKGVIYHSTEALSTGRRQSHVYKQKKLSGSPQYATASLFPWLQYLVVCFRHDINMLSALGKAREGITFLAIAFVL